MLLVCRERERERGRERERKREREREWERDGKKEIIFCSPPWNHHKKGFRCSHKPEIFVVTGKNGNLNYGHLSPFSHRLLWKMWAFENQSCCGQLGYQVMPTHGKILQLSRNFVPDSRWRIDKIWIPQFQWNCLRDPNNFLDRWCLYWGVLK